MQIIKIYTRKLLPCIWTTLIYVNTNIIINTLNNINNSFISI